MSIRSDDSGKWSKGERSDNMGGEVHMKYFKLDELTLGIGGIEHGYADLRFTWDIGQLKSGKS